jgi:formate-dependent nitrite reductase membrane component NrfD
VTELRPTFDGTRKPAGTTSWDGSVTEAGTTMRSYYGRPVIKPPVWQPEIPMYFFTGGLGGATSIVSLAAKIAGRDEQARRLLYAGFVAEALSPALLTADLGRPERFLNMLRLFKPTSPMSVGSWVLVAANMTAGLGATLELLDRAPRLKVAAEVASALSAPR